LESVQLLKKVQSLPRLVLHDCNMLCIGHWCIYFTIFSYIYIYIYIYI
jgi:hypothetical protein